MRSSIIIDDLSLVDDVAHYLEEISKSAFYSKCPSSHSRRTSRPHIETSSYITLRHKDNCGVTDVYFDLKYM